MYLQLKSRNVILGMPESTVQVYTLSCLNYIILNNYFILQTILTFEKAYLHNILNDFALLKIVIEMELT